MDRPETRARLVGLDVIAQRDARPYPEGWYRLMESASIKAGAVETVRASGRDIVVFRTMSGAIGAVDAYCPHLGAHLGHGGRVHDESLRCPFHGLRFATDGRCVGHESPGHFQPRARVAAWPVREWEGQVMVFLSHDAHEPSWELPELACRHDFTALRWHEIELEGHVQDIAENGVDFSHFRALHRYFDLGTPELRFDGPHIHSKFSFRRKSPILPSVMPSMRNVFDTEIHGFGCSITNLTVEEWRLRAQLLIMPRQLEAKRVRFAIGVRVSVGAALGKLDRSVRGRGSAPFLRLLLKLVMDDALQDKRIWQHRVPLARPALLPGDGPLGEFRRYAAQFYPTREQLS